MTQSNAVLSLLDLNPRKYGSLEEYMVRVSDALRQRNCRSIIAFPEEVPANLREKFEGSGAELELMPSEGWPLYSGLLRLLRKHRPRIVHFHFYNQFSILPLLAATSHPKSILFTDHSRLPVDRPSTRAKCAAWDRIVLGSLGVQTLAVSAHVKRILIQNYGMSPAHVGVLFNGVNVSRFAAPTPESRAAFFSEFEIPQDKKVVVAAGYFIPEKGLGDLLKAAAKIRETRQDVIFILVGDGPLEHQLKDEAHSLKIDDIVRFTGLRFDVDRFMSASDVVVVPSTWQEPAGLVVVEAMATSRPVIASRVGGIPEYLSEGEAGLLVEPSNPSQIAAAILKILDNSAMAHGMGLAGRRRAEQFFSMEKWVADTMAVYEPSLDSTLEARGDLQPQKPSR
ncbi:MAG TPA: glycosyltransferase family 4 protein [Armatimonadota bacterium]|jgi:glycosyltransferase involved in cell wall biosynthesis